MAATMEVLSLSVTVGGSDVLRRAVAGYLARYKGLSRSHTESDPRVFLGWCTERGLEPLAAQRPHIDSMCDSRCMRNMEVDPSHLGLRVP
jgi:hypothetical protein